MKDDHFYAGLTCNIVRAQYLHLCVFVKDVFHGNNYNQHVVERNSMTEGPKTWLLNSWKTITKIHSFHKTIPRKPTGKEINNIIILFSTLSTKTLRTTRLRGILLTFSIRVLGYCERNIVTTLRGTLENLLFLFFSFNLSGFFL